MNELTEISFNEDCIVLKDHRVRTSILPTVSRELDRDIQIHGKCLIEGAVYARNLTIQQGGIKVQGAVFAQTELHVNSDAKGMVFFDKAVASGQAIVSHAAGCRMHFLSDVSAKRVHLRHAYVAASIYGDDVVLEDCVVIGGVFATRSLELNNCVVGTFNSPTVRASRMVYLLFPSAFSVERMGVLPGSTFWNLTLADLGSLLQGVPCAPHTGKIRMEVDTDEVRTVLVGENAQQVVRTYSVVGKVLASDLLDMDKLQNHFLLSCAGLGSQLARTYQLGGEGVELTPQRIAAFFFDLLWGKVEVPELDGTFQLQDILGRFGAETGGASPVAWDGAAPAGASGDEALEDTALHCGQCGGPVQLDTAFCESCGHPLKEALGGLPESGAEPVPPEPEAGSPAAEPEAPALLFCDQCGAKLPPGSLFCSDCGHRLE